MREAKKILVAGASGGIGTEIVLELTSACAEVFALGRSLERLSRLRARHHIVADLTKPSDIERIRETVAPLDALILSAGIYQRSDDPEIFRRQLDTNVVGPYALIRALLPTLVQSRGEIIFINSSQALRGSANVGQYAATMHAAKAIADSLRDEVNGLGVRVTSLYLGRTAGERQRKLFKYEGRAYPPEKLIQPIDIAKTVHYLLQMPRTAEVTDLMIRPMRKA